MLLEELVALKRKNVEYAGLIELMVKDGITGLLESDESKLRNIIDQHEPRSNLTEIKIDEICTTLIAKYQPKAKELRTILMILGMNRDLERMGDHAVNIAKSALYLIERPSLAIFNDLSEMSLLVNRMLADSIEAFIKENSQLSNLVSQADDEVDLLRSKILRELICCMSCDSSTIERALHVIRISGNLERIADLATNICEEIIFMVDGKIVKHHLDDEE